MKPCQYWENISSLMDGWMMEVGLYHLLCIAVENPINRSLGRHRLYPLLCERLLDGSGPTVFAMLGQRLAQGHDNLGDALGRFGRGGSGASAQFCAPGEIRCQVAIPPFVEPAFRAGQFPADVLYGVACEVSVDGPLSALFVRFRHGGLLWSLLPFLTYQIAPLFSMSWHDQLGCGCMSRRLGAVRAAGYPGSGHLRWWARSCPNRSNSSSSAQMAQRPPDTSALRLCTQPKRCHLYKVAHGIVNRRAKSVNQYSCTWRTLDSSIDRGREPCRPRWLSNRTTIPPVNRCVRLGGEKPSRLSSTAICAKLSPASRRVSMRDNRTGYVESCA